MDDLSIQAAVEGLRASLQRASRDPAVNAILTAKQEVLERYGKLFNPTQLRTLTADDYWGFLRLENNRHWSQMCRGGNQAANDIEALRKGMGVLLDESIPIADRFNRTKVRGLGRSIKSAILLVAYPDLYGVWNNTSEKGLIFYRVFPRVQPKMDKGKTYFAINEILKRLAKELRIDLWTLDALWWEMSPKRSDKLISQLARLGGH